MFRSQMSRNRVWGYQAEVDTADRKWSGGLYDEDRRMWFISPNRDHAASPEERDASIAAFRARAGECFKQGQWNKYRIVCIGSHIQIFVNDVLTTDIHDEMDLAGHIGIQHHGERGLVYKFRNLRIKDLGVGGELCYPHREGASAAAVPSKMEGSSTKRKPPRSSMTPRSPTTTPDIRARVLWISARRAASFEWTCAGGYRGAVQADLPLCRRRKSPVRFVDQRPKRRTYSVRRHGKLDTLADGRYGSNIPNRTQRRSRRRLRPRSESGGNGR
jgi:hypothetical protein